MKVYTTEEEQLQALISWFKSYGIQCAVLLALMATLIIGWQYWRNYQVDYIESASILYEKMQNSINSTEQSDLANNLATNFSSSIYGKIANSYLANKKVFEGKWQDAADKYQQIYQETKSWPDLQIVVFENWIRSQLELKQYQKAFDNLTTIENQSDLVKLYPLNFYNLKGDVLFHLNKNPDAVIAYNKAIEAVENNPMFKQHTVQFTNWVVLKRNDLLAAKPLV